MTDPTDGGNGARTEDGRRSDDGSQIGIWQKARDTHASKPAKWADKRRRLTVLRFSAQRARERAKRV